MNDDGNHSHVNTEVISMWPMSLLYLAVASWPRVLDCINTDFVRQVADRMLLLLLDAPNTETKPQKVLEVGEPGTFMLLTQRSGMSVSSRMASLFRQRFRIKQLVCSFVQLNFNKVLALRSWVK